MRGITEERFLFSHSFISVIYSLHCMLFTLNETSHNASMRCCEIYNCVMLQETAVGGVRRYTFVWALRVVLAVTRILRGKKNLLYMELVPKLDVTILYNNNCPTRCNKKQSIYYSASSLYMFQVLTTPIIRNTQNCNYSLRYWS